jgi:hypothetical protein
MRGEQLTNCESHTRREVLDPTALEDPIGEVVPVVSLRPQVHDLSAVGGVVEARRDLLGGSSTGCIAIHHDRDASASQKVRPCRMPGVRSWDRDRWETGRSEGVRFSV